MRILGIIPARGGSKGIPNKNIIDLCGKPLISWSIKTGIDLLEKNVLSRCIISTDNNKIAKIANEYGADACRLYLANSPLVRAEPLKF